MRIRLVFVLLCIFSLTLQAETPISPPITEVTVFRSGAKITRSERVLLPSGKSEVIFENLSPYFNASSLQIKIEGDATLHGAVFQKKTPGPAPENPRIPIIRDSLVAIGDILLRYRNEQDILQQEEQLIQTNLAKIGEKTKDGIILNLEEVREMTAFFHKEMMRIKERYLQMEIEKRMIDKENRRLNADLLVLQPNVGNNTGEIVMRVEASAKRSVTITCTYLISQTGWTPLYDIKSKNSESPLNLIYKANVMNNSGFDWKNVKLTLSSAQPLANNERPKLAPIFIDFRTYAQTQKIQATLEESVIAYQMTNMATEVRFDKDRVEPLGFIFEAENPNDIATVFEIIGLQDILANGEENIVQIQDQEIPADYEFHTVPKLDQAVYLLAKVVNYGHYNLLPGRANIFFQDTYIGQSYLNPNTSADTMLISLGRDEQIYVKRCQPKDYTYKKKFLHTKVKEEFAYEITIKNNKTTNITVNILDQIPVSKQEDIEVDLIRKDGAEYNKDFGKLEWNVTVKPGTSEVIRFAYSLKYPKDKGVAVGK